MFNADAPSSFLQPLIFCAVSGQESLEGIAIILIIPLWKRGVRGDFKNRCFLMINS